MRSAYMCPLLAACAGPAYTGTTPGASAQDAEGTTFEVLGALEDLAVEWTIPEGSSLFGWYLVGDVTGDGLQDSVVVTSEVEDRVATYTNWFVAGPLLEAKVLPEAAFATFAFPGIFTSIHLEDIDEDGVTDLVGDLFDDQAYETDRLHRMRVLPPWEGELVLDETVDFTGVEDFDFDGILDYVEPAPAYGQRVWLGPSPDRAGPPDLELDFVCPVEGTVWQDIPRYIPDVTGDGAMEVFFHSVDDPACGLKLHLSLDDVGEVSAATHPDRRVTFVSPFVWPDQNGDGILDVYWHGQLYAGPVALEELQITGTVLADFTGLTVNTTDADVDGDGVPELLVMDATGTLSEGATVDSPTYSLVRGGQLGETRITIGNSAASYVWADEIFAENGGAGVLLYGNDRRLLVAPLELNP